MYYPIIIQLTQGLQNLANWLDKAEEHANAKNFDVNVFMQSRLIADMDNLLSQIIMACDFAKFAVARLTNQIAPKYEDNEKTIEEIRTRIKKTIKYIQSIKEEMYKDADKREIHVYYNHDKIQNSEDYFRQLVIPNFYFHLITAYNILRHNGVNIGKADFLGPLKIKNAI